MTLCTIHHLSSRLGLALLGVITAQGLVQSELSAGTAQAVPPTSSEPSSSALDFITKGALAGEFRLRCEYGEQDPFDASNAVTLRRRLGLLTGESAGWRRNEQPDDAVTLSNSSPGDLKLFDGYIWLTQQISGSEPARERHARHASIEIDTQILGQY